MVKNKEKEFIHGLMVLDMTENGMTIKYAERVYINGQMEDVMKESG